MSELKRYIDAMRFGNTDACIRIEKQHDLYGYTPEIVSVGLAAVDRGEDAQAAIEAHFDARSEEFP